MSLKETNTSDGLDLLLAVLPAHIVSLLGTHPRRDELLEVVLDLGRVPEARFPSEMVLLSSSPVTREDLSKVIGRLGKFGDDNRAGIERTLHRISAIRNRAGSIVGLTCRVGRAVYGTVDILRDVIESGKSLLLLGRPGVGKTTLLREAARVLADDLGRRVIIVDTSNEIGGDGDIPHPGIGRARRMQVPSTVRQHAVMIEAIENHMPEVIVIDEIGTEAEALAARTIAERGVQLIATVHGNTLENLLQNPTLSDLVGGVQTVTLSDEEARRRGTQKTVPERKAPPTFGVLIEIQDRTRLAVYHNVAQTVDLFLRGMALEPELRLRGTNGTVEIFQEKVEPPIVVPGIESTPGRQLLKRGRRTLRVFPFGVSRIQLERAVHKFKAPVVIVDDLDRADLVLTLKSQEKRQSRRLREAEARGMPFYSIRSNTALQVESFLRSAFGSNDHTNEDEAAIRDLERAMIQVRESGTPVELPVQTRDLRKLQHVSAERHGFSTRSKGHEPRRRVVLFPGEASGRSGDGTRN